MNKATAEALPAGSDPANGANQRSHSRTGFVHVIRALAEDFRRRPEEWENRDLSSYLDAMAAWVEDMDGYYRNRGETVPEQPTWETLEHILRAAKIYE